MALNWIIACFRLTLGLSIKRSHKSLTRPTRINYFDFKLTLPIIEPSLIIYRLNYGWSTGKQDGAYETILEQHSHQWRMWLTWYCIREVYYYGNSWDKAKHLYKLQITKHFKCCITTEFKSSLEILAMKIWLFIKNW